MSFEQKEVGEEESLQEKYVQLNNQIKERLEDFRMITNGLGNTPFRGSEEDRARTADRAAQTFLELSELIEKLKDFKVYQLGIGPDEAHLGTNEVVE